MGQFLFGFGQLFIGVKFDACGRSFTYKANNRGPSDEPWGTPRLTPWVADLNHPTTVYCCLSYKLVRSLCGNPLIP